MLRGSLQDILGEVLLCMKIRQVKVSVCSDKETYEHSENKRQGSERQVAMLGQASSPVTSWKGLVEISLPEPATPMTTDCPHPLCVHSSACLITFTFPMHSKE